MCWLVYYLLLLLCVLDVRGPVRLKVGGCHI